MCDARVLNRAHIKGLIAQGQLIVISGKQVLCLDKWIERHPGGRLPILHMVGKDATDQILVYHSPEVLKQMRAYRIGVIDSPWINFEPPISGGTFNLGDQQEKDQVDSKNIAIECQVSSRWFEDLSSVSDTLKLSSSKYSAAKFIDHATQLAVDVDLNEYPSLDAETQRNISINFRKLYQKVRQSGLDKCHISNYGMEVVRYITLFSLFILALRYEWYIVSAVFLGLFWHQIMFVAHDAGHLAITHNFNIDMMIGIFVADFCCGLSIGWWKSSHNVHHLVPNHPEHDPDIQNVPLFATSSSFFSSLCSTYYGSIFPWDAAADLFIPLQKYTYYPIMCVARFNLYFLSWCYLISDKAARLPCSTWTRPFEIACMACYWYLFGYCLVWSTIPSWPLRVAFVLVSHIATMPLHVQITLSHWGMSTTDLGASESFAQKQLRTTMDVDCPAWLDFIHGGLQFQAVHHLFPRMPRHNLRGAQKLVREFCKEIGIRYTIFGFVDGNEVVLGRLGEISKQLDMLTECQMHLAAQL
ncbi:hypothetical protein OIDMADRAFT_136877 [Oidiodendron maius Zn]|uniref:Delta 8-(E)-sphingolipid desaturase n=1 Tax=Oidiodendron maius (strain Zn) TaxID=913774 RepID=A0A0C3GCQ4_OIDMZ|nr:hypothetical protein OIDMADRAFT_136877 [Oidiodendron maius Zn]